MNAITDVIDDLTSGRPMDRLVCGDVGFGKTEIAMRAAFLASIAGYQVAVIAPTTLLVRQHTKSFLDRFRGLPVEVRQLSRFVSKKEAEKTSWGQKEKKGKVRIMKASSLLFLHHFWIIVVISLNSLCIFCLESGLNYSTAPLWL